MQRIEAELRKTAGGSQKASDGVFSETSLSGLGSMQGLQRNG